MADELRILFFIYDLERGGPELRLLDFLKHFPREVVVYIFVTTNKLSLLPEFQKYTVNIKVIPIKKGYVALHKACQIQKFVKANGISIVCSYDLKDLFVSSFVKLFSGYQINTVYHCVELLKHYTFFKKCILSLLLGITDAVLCNSETSKKIIGKLFFQKYKLRVIKNGIDIETFQKGNCDAKDLKNKLGLVDNSIVLGTLANFRREKNYPFLLDAFKVLSRRHSELRLICVGGGNCLEDMKIQCREYGLEDVVLFTDYTDDVFQYLAVMDIFVFCSLTESFPNALLQAMSMELPVIASNVGGCSEIINHMQNGILYSSNHRDGFVTSVEMLIRDRFFAATLAANARKTIVEEFSLKRMIKEYVAFYKSVSSPSEDLRL